MKIDEQYSLRFGGVERLYGSTSATKIANSHILLIGLGGVGSWTCEALARSGVGEISLMDFDDICISNTNRQLHALDGEVGKQKTQSLKERLVKINPAIKIHLIEEPYSKELNEKVFESKFDVVIDAIDDSPAKFELILACRERKIPLVVSGSAGGRVDPTQIRMDDLSKTREDKMLSLLRKRLRQKAKFPRFGSLGLACVYSLEKPIYLDGQGEPTHDKPQDFRKPLDCRTGFGTVAHFTGAMGFALAHAAIQKIIAR